MILAVVHKYINIYYAGRDKKLQRDETNYTWLVTHSDSSVDERRATIKRTKLMLMGTRL